MFLHFVWFASFYKGIHMQALYENLSTGRTTEKLADKDDFRLLADCNGDGAVNILDYQKLYQGIKTA